MMTNREKFLALVSNEPTDTLARAIERVEKRQLHRLTFNIAILILWRLDQLGWTQKKLAEELNVSPQLVNRWVKGKENFTLETLVNIGKVLGIDLIRVNEIPDEPETYKTRDDKDSNLLAAEPKN